MNFPLAPLGHVPYWLAAGPSETLYSGPAGDDDFVRTAGIDPAIAVPPAAGVLGAAGPFGTPWTFRYPGRNFFCEFTTFSRRITCIDVYAFTELVAEHAGPRDALLWAAGVADLWVNGGHVARFSVPRYMYPDAENVTLPLRAGRNGVCVRLQVVGIRDTRILAGLQLKNPQGLAIHIPGGDALPGAVSWLDGVRVAAPDRLVSAAPPPARVRVTVPNAMGVNALPEAAPAWPAGASACDLAGVRPDRLTVTVEAAGQTLSRDLEIPANQAFALASTRSPASPEARRSLFLHAIAAQPFDERNPHGQHQLPLLARRLLKQTSPHDARGLELCLGVIDRREDCADFRLSGLLRLVKFGLATPAEAGLIRRTALGFRYWSDEPGQDAMCFGSENHSLLFHGCQLMAGQLYPEAVFTASGRTGGEQAELAETRIRQWLDHIEARGIDEFHSSTYMPLTVAALLNIVDFAGAAESSRRAARIIDALYETMAAHAFQGVVVAPQGRVYRNVLYPEKSGTQSLLAFAAADILVDPAQASEWVAFLCHTRYRVPERVGALAAAPASLQYCGGVAGGWKPADAFAEITLRKTDAWLLTSVAVPSRRTRTHAVFTPGHAGYQQHLWQATLGPGCHVFVNHPGCSMDEAGSRPGYWYGCGIMPRLEQKDGMLFSIFNIPDGSGPVSRRSGRAWFSPPWCGEPAFGRHPIPFTHAHWPADAFDRERHDGQWLFGQKGVGAVALWCSTPLVPHDDVLTGREYRAWAHRAAWLAVCGKAEGERGFAAFMDACRARPPSFDAATLALRTGAGNVFSWERGLEPGAARTE